MPHFGTTLNHLSYSRFDLAEQLSNLGPWNNDIRLTRNLNGMVSAGSPSRDQRQRKTAETCTAKCGRLVDAQLSRRACQFTSFIETSVIKQNITFHSAQ